jgi:hypothetical protein
MKIARWISILTLAAATATLVAQTPSAQPPAGPPSADSAALPSTVDAQDVNHGVDETDLLEKSREAGLLTDWHLDGRFGHGGAKEFAHVFAPEKEASKQSAGRFVRRRYELVFPEGIFTLPKELADAKGVFYAISTTYLTTGGDWNVYLETAAEAVVFIDGHRAVTSDRRAPGVLRGTIHIESGYHSVMVKFSAPAAPFRVAILPLNSGSRRKNNTPYLQASPASDDMLAWKVSPTVQSVRDGF